jgi:hypothetical protein
MIASGAMPSLFNAPEFFRVDMDKVSRSLELIALHWLGWLQVR